MKLWGGCYDADSDPLFTEFNDSLPVDCRLVQEDIRGSIAWAGALGRAGVLSADESQTIQAALREIATEAGSDPQALIAGNEEDVHTWVEARLIERIGELGKKLHTGRSRNDQVATDLRLWLRAALDARRREIRAVQQALLRLARRESETVIPGYTHLQRAQPVLLAHWCMAYVEMLARDGDRFADAARRADRCPLGCGALSGTAYPIDREALASDLGFAGPTANSLDTVSDRDFVVESISAAALCAVHLSRLAEDLIFYASSEAGFVSLDDSMTSGSSLMPQKRNPDALELVRGKSGRILGDLVTTCVMLKGLPLAYNKDLQEDKEPLFDAMDQISLCLRVVVPVLDRLEVDRAVARCAAEGSYANATELADYLVGRGVPFRDAHELSGQIVRQASRDHVSLEQMPVESMTAVAPQIGSDVAVHLTIDATLGKRDVIGGTALSQVNAAVAAAERAADSHLAVDEAASEVCVGPATLDHVEGICRLVDHWAAVGENLPRGRGEVIELIQEFTVATRGREVVGCGSLVMYGPKLAEIRSLGVDPTHQGGGVGARLVEKLVAAAHALHVPRVFVLTRVPEFFSRVGFERAPIQSLPEKVFRDCAKCFRRDRCDEVAMVRKP